jgi:serine/threonine-protein kinase
MEHLEGRTLSELLEAEGHLAPGRAAHIGRQIAKGLAAAHAAGIVHRDLKPDNVFLVDRDGDPDFVKILDFGIAKVASAQNQLTRAGSVFGTPQYMSPEQATAAPVDHRSDIYALGVILYEMAVGKVPFDNEGPLTVMSMHVNESPLAPSAHPEAPQRIPQVLEGTILRCLAKDPAERFFSMTELANALKRAEEPHAISHEAPVVLTRRKLDTGALPSVRATVSNVPPPFARPDRRRWIAIGAGGAAAALIALAIATRRGGEAAPPAATSIAAVAPVPPPPPRPAPAATAPAPPAAPESKRQVAIVVSPIDAVIYRGKDRLGQMPISVSVPPGERVRLVFLREGFWPRKVTIDGSKPRVIVRMAPIPGAKLRVPVPVSSAPAEPETDEETEAPEGSPQPPASARPAASAKAAPSAKTGPATSTKAAPATSAKAAPAASAKAAATDEPSEE